MVKSLLDTDKINVNVKDDYGRTPLHLAMWQEHAAIVKLLLDTEKVKRNLRNNAGRTVLHAAALFSDEIRVLVLKLLLDTGKANVNARDNDGKTALDLAIARKHTAITELL